MNQMFRSVMERLPFIILAALLNFMCLLLSAELIEEGITDSMSMSILCIISVIISVSVETFFSAAKFGNPYVGYSIALIFLLISIIASLTCGKSPLFDATIVKTIISLICGVLLGNFFGKRKYYKKLRKFRK